MLPPCRCGPRWAYIILAIFSLFYDTITVLAPARLWRLPELVGSRTRRARQVRLEGGGGRRPALLGQVSDVSRGRNFIGPASGRPQPKAPVRGGGACRMRRSCRPPAATLDGGAGRRPGIVRRASAVAQRPCRCGARRPRPYALLIGAARAPAPRMRRQPLAVPPPEPRPPAAVAGRGERGSQVAANFGGRCEEGAGWRARSRQACKRRAARGRLGPEARACPDRPRAGPACAGPKRP